MFSKYSKLNTFSKSFNTSTQQPLQESVNEIILQNEKRILKREENISTYSSRSGRVFVSKEGIPHVISIKEQESLLQLYNTKTFEIVQIPFNSTAADCSFDVNTTTGEILLVQPSNVSIHAFDGVEKCCVELSSVSTCCPFRDGFLLLSKHDGSDCVYFFNNRNSLKKVYHWKNFISILFSSTSTNTTSNTNTTVMKSWNDDSVFLSKQNGIVEYYKYNTNTELLQHIKDISISEEYDDGGNSVVVSDFVVVCGNEEGDFSLIVLSGNGRMYRVSTFSNDSTVVVLLNENGVKVANGKLCISSSSSSIGGDYQLVSVYSTKEISTYTLSTSATAAAATATAAAATAAAATAAAATAATNGKYKLELYDVIRIIGISSVISLAKENLYYILSYSGDSTDGQAVLYSLEYYPSSTAPSSPKNSFLDSNQEDNDDDDLEIDRILDLVAFSTQNVSVLLRQQQQQQQKQKSLSSGFTFKLKKSLSRIVEKIYRFSSKEDILDILKEKSTMLQRLLDYLERNQINLTAREIYGDCFKLSVRLLAGKELFKYYTVNSEFVESLVKRLIAMELEQSENEESFGVVKIFFQLYLDRIEELVELYHDQVTSVGVGNNQDEEELLLRLVELCLCCYYPYLSVGNVSVSVNSVELLRNVYDCALSVLDGEYLVKMSELLVYFMHNHTLEDSIDGDGDDDDYKSVVVSVIKNLSQYNNIVAIQLCERYKLLYGLVALSSESSSQSMLFDLCTEYGEEFVKCLVEEYLSQKRLKELMDILFMEDLQREFKVQEYASTLSQELKWLILLRRRQYKKGLDVMMMEQPGREKDIAVLKKIVALAAVESQQMMEDQLQEYMVL